MKWHALAGAAAVSLIFHIAGLAVLGFRLAGGRIEETDKVGALFTALSFACALYVTFFYGLLAENLLAVQCWFYGEAGMVAVTVIICFVLLSGGSATMLAVIVLSSLLLRLLILATSYSFLLHLSNTRKLQKGIRVEEHDTEFQTTAG